MLGICIGWIGGDEDVAPFTISVCEGGPRFIVCQKLVISEAHDIVFL